MLRAFTAAVAASLFFVISLVPPAYSQSFRFKGNYCENAIDVVIKPLASDAHPGLRPYHGVWTGQWSSKTCVVLVVSEVLADRAKVYYYYSRGIDIPNPGNWQADAVFDRGSLYMTSPKSRAPIWFSATGAGLDGRFSNMKVLEPLQRVITNQAAR